MRKRRDVPPGFRTCPECRHPIHPSIRGCPECGHLAATIGDLEPPPPPKQIKPWVANAIAIAATLAVAGLILWGLLYLRQLALVEGREHTYF